jgi:hypothetical protein
MVYDKNINPDCISIHEVNWACSLHFRDWKIVYAVKPGNTIVWFWDHTLQMNPVMDRVFVDIKRKFK